MTHQQNIVPPPLAEPLAKRVNSPRVKKIAADHPSDPARQPWSRHDLLAVALLVVAVVIAFWPAMRGDFLTWDDTQTVSQNPHLNPAGLGSLRWCWTREHMHLYVPVTYTLWTIVAWIAQQFDAVRLRPEFFHATNLIVHATSAVVVFAVLRRFTRQTLAAAVGAMVFAVHPLQVEPVAWISGTKDLLCGLLMWTTISLAIRSADAVDGDRKSSRRFFALATAVFIAAMLAKPTAVVTPLILFAVETLLLHRPAKTVLKRTLPWVAIALACVVLTKIVQPADQTAPDVPIRLRPLIAGDALAFYLYKLILPFDLTIDHGRSPQFVMRSPTFYFAWLVPAGVALLLWRGRRVPMLVRVGGIVFLLSLAPVLGLVRFDFQQYSTVGEHYLYPAMAGVAMAVAAIAGRLRPRTAVGVAAPLLLACVAISFHNAGNWRNNLALFTHTVRVNPTSWPGLNNLAAAQLEAGAAHEAIVTGTKAAELQPGDANVQVTLAAAYARTGQTPVARSLYEKALSLRPGDSKIHSAYAGLLAEAGDLPAAVRHAKTAVELDPENAEAYLNLGTLAAQQNDLDTAATQLSRAVRLAPHNLQARANLGFVLLMQGRKSDAAEQFRRALAIDPNFEPARQGMMQVNARP